MSAGSCQYAKTREQLNPDSANSDNNWCWYFENMEGVDRDMHGAHMVFTRGFYNVHVSHVELFDVGQPRLARYPIHWHHAHYVGEKGKYDDPSSAISLRQVNHMYPMDENTRVFTYLHVDDFSFKCVLVILFD